MSDKRRNTRRRAARSNDQDSEQSLFVPTKKHDQYQRWSEDEHRAYVQYLEQHIDDFTIQKGKKRKNLFMRMSDEIKCHKSNEQCRTHHEKMLKKYQNIENIIKSLREPEAFVKPKPEIQEKFLPSSTFRPLNKKPVTIITSGQEKKETPLKENILSAQKVPKNSKIDPTHRAFDPKIMTLPNLQDEENSKEDLPKLEIPGIIMADMQQGGPLTLRNYQTPQVPMRNLTPGSFGFPWGMSDGPLISPGLPLPNMGIYGSSYKY